MQRETADLANCKILLSAKPSGQSMTKLRPQFSKNLRRRSHSKIVLKVRHRKMFQNGAFGLRSTHLQRVFFGRKAGSAVSYCLVRYRVPKKLGDDACWDCYLLQFITEGAHLFLIFWIFYHMQSYDIAPGSIGPFPLMPNLLISSPVTALENPHEFCWLMSAASFRFSHSSLLSLKRLSPSFPVAASIFRRLYSAPLDRMYESVSALLRSSHQFCIRLRESPKRHSL